MHHRSHARSPTHVTCLCFAGGEEWGRKEHLGGELWKRHVCKSANFASANEACTRAGLELVNSLTTVENAGAPQAAAQGAVRVRGTVLGPLRRARGRPPQTNQPHRPSETTFWRR